MKLGLIGYPLGHSWSNEIHPYLIGEDYSKWQLPPDELESFMRDKDFDGINVTIPYKTQVIPYLDELTPIASEIGAVNCIVNRNGKLIGDNTDYQGLKDMLVKHDVPVSGHHVAILGSGGASKAASTVVKNLGGIPVVVSRHPHKGMVSYEQLYEEEAFHTVIINATPVGMFPDSDEVPVDIHRFTKLQYVVDIVANPLRTRLQFEAAQAGIPVLSGFEMLVRQAACADEVFGKSVKEERILQCIQYLKQKKQNIVLIGMPTSGKSTIAKKLSKATGYPVVEMDEELEKQFGTSISKVFEEKGEAYFRQAETQLARDLRNQTHTIISCGGGIIKNSENMRYLQENGVVIWIDRKVENLFPTSSRPLSKDVKAIQKMYTERKSLYERYSDYTVENNADISSVVKKIECIIQGGD